MTPVVSRERVLTWLVLGCAFASVALPLCVVRYVPFVDYPDHLAQIATIANVGDPRFSPYYTLALAKSQYFSFYLPAVALAKIVGTELGTRIVLVGALAGLPLAVAAYLAAHKRSMMPAALAGFVALNIQTFWGFINFILGVTVGILAIAAHARLVERPDTRRAAVFGVAALVCFYAHPYMYVWLVGACWVQTLCMVPNVGWRQAAASAWRGVLAGVPSALALLFWLHASQVLEHGEAGARADVGTSVQESHLTFTPPADMIAHWRDHSFTVYVDGAGTALANLFLGAILALFALRLVLLALRRGSSAASSLARARARADGFAPEAVLAFSLAAFVYGPESYKLVGGINPRFIVVGFALLPVLAPVAIPARVRPWVAGGIVGLLVYHAIVHLQHFRQLDAEMGDLDEALTRTAPGKRLLGLIYDPRSELVPLALYLHGHQYYQSRVGGMAAWGFVELAHSPVSYRAGVAPAPFPPRFEWEPERFQWDRWGLSFDYFLARTPHGRSTPWAFRYETAGLVKNTYDGSRWKLYERLDKPVREHPAAVDPGPDSLVISDLVVGTGPQARKGDRVTVAFTGTLMDSTPVFRTPDGEARRLTFNLGAGESIKGFDRGLPGIRVGGKRELILTPDDGFGGAGQEPDIPPGAGLIVHVELLGVVAK